MRTVLRVGVLLLLTSLGSAACGRQATEAVTTDTLGTQAAAALDCASAMHQNADQGTSELFMDPNATAAQIESVRTQLAGDPSVVDLRFVSQDDAFAEFTSLFGDSPQLMSDVRAALLPSSFRFTFTPTGPPSTSDPLERYRGAPGVKQLVTISERSRCAETDPTMLRAAQRMIDNRFGPNGLIVFMDPEQLDRVPVMRATLEAMPAVRGIVFVSQDAALNEFQCLFKNDPNTLGDVGKDILPPSFRIDVGPDDAVVQRTGAELKQQPGVRAVVQRPTPAQLLTPGGSLDPSASPSTKADSNCPVQGQRIR